ncbi:outer membrane lipoprotein carrier protein LolA [Starkeya koreensis]|uniref:Outer membrane lipoprotein carrier protein LolA n=1 Tax=Ancylobacter koreensis TaxID=266121 RepID=A0ABT0DHG4_9HYPH|nr:outer-membrane lipoprotein carrier protein LolA [Ancylobacter koreensis]MCK0206522.1 outer membrane lipoprotein carrier protein LolA [Ancylobacter koreensis]
MRHLIRACAASALLMLPPGAALAQVPPPPFAAPLPPKKPAQATMTRTAQASPAAVAPPAARPAAAKPVAAKPAAAGAQADPTIQMAAASNRRAAADTVQRISDYFNSFKTMTGDFVQVDPDGTRRQGEFYILKPGRVLFEYAPPSPIELVADGRSVAVRDKRLKTQDISPLSATPLRFLLSEDFDLARNTNVTGVYQDDIFATVVLEEKQPMVGTYRLMIMFDANTMQLKQWTVTDPQGYDTTVAVSNLNTADRPDPALFVINRN